MRLRDWLSSSRAPWPRSRQSDLGRFCRGIPQMVDDRSYLQVRGVPGLTPADPQVMPDEFLLDELGRRLAAGPVSFEMSAGTRRSVRNGPTSIKSLLP